MVNLTLSLDEALLAKAKLAARHQHSSLNQWVRGVLAERLAADETQPGLDDWFRLADSAMATATPDPLPADGGRGWQRADLYRAGAPG